MLLCFASFRVFPKSVVFTQLALFAHLSLCVVMCCYFLFYFRGSRECWVFCREPRHFKKLPQLLDARTHLKVTMRVLFGFAAMAGASEDGFGGHRGASANPENKHGSADGPCWLGCQFVLHWPRYEAVIHD